MLALGASSEYCLARLPNSAGLAAARAWTFWAFSAVVQTISRALTAAPYSISKASVNSFWVTSQPFARQLPQRQAGPDDVVGILLGLDSPLLLQQLHPLLDRQTEALGHLLDLFIDLAARNGDPHLPALGENQVLVDHRLQHFLAVMDATLHGQFIAADGVAVDRGHHVGNRRAAGNRRRRASRPAGADRGESSGAARGGGGTGSRRGGNLRLGRRLCPSNSE